MIDLSSLVIGLAAGLLAGATVATLAFRAAIDQLAHDAVARHWHAADKDQGRGYEDPEQDWPGHRRVDE